MRVPKVPSDHQACYSETDNSNINEAQTSVNLICSFKFRKQRQDLVFLTVISHFCQNLSGCELLQRERFVFFKSLCNRSNEELRKVDVVGLWRKLCLILSLWPVKCRAVQTTQACGRNGGSQFHGHARV